MARKRKIPARKHHGVRDPLKQLEEREKKLKNVTNNPPESGNDQKVSFKFAQFKKLADAAKAGKKIRKLHSGLEDKPIEKTNSKSKTANSGNKIRQIKQLDGEADTDYLRRVNRITTESLREAQYEAKYGVNVVRDPKTGAITIKKRPKNEIDELLKQKQKEKRAGKLGKKRKKTENAKPLDPKLAKELIKQAIKEDNEEKKKERFELQEYKRDDIKFGEVVHAPPTISTLPRKAVKSETVPRPGKKSNLLLKSLLNGEGAITTNSENTSTVSKTKQKSGVTSKAQLKGRRKDLPAATRQMLESERSKFVDLYRNLRKKTLINL